MTVAKAPLVLLAAAVVLIGAAVLLFSLVDLGGSAGPQEGVTISDLADEPTRYDGETVTVSGEYAENDYFAPADAPVAMVIGDDAGKRLLVLPQPSASVPAIDESTVVRVTGTVAVAESGDGSDAAGYLRQGGLLEPGSPEAVIEAREVDLIIPPDATEQSAGAPQAATVARVLRDAAELSGGSVSVVGEVSATSERGFTLTQDGRSIFVSTAGSNPERIDTGERVRVVADVSRLSEFRARQLAEALGPDAPEPDDPYLLLRTLDASPASG